MFSVIKNIVSDPFSIYLLHNNPFFLEMSDLSAIMKMAGKYMNNIAGKQKYISLVTGWSDRAEKIRDEKYIDWHDSVEKRLNSPYFNTRLAGLLGIKDPENLSKYGSKNQLIAAVTGFNEAEIEKLRWLPSDRRDLMFAFAFVLGYEYQLLTTKDGKLIVDCSPELNQYFDDADMPLPDYRNLDDYIAICAAMYYSECNRKKVYGKNRMITLYDLQDNLRNQMSSYILDLDEFVSWPDFFEYYTSLFKLTNAKIKKITGFEKYNTLEWKKRVPEEPEVLFMICILFHFTLIQSVLVFDRFYNQEDKVQRPDFENSEDLRWLYLVENFWKLKELHFEDQIQAVRDYYDQNNLRRSTDLSILQYHEIFQSLTFAMDQKQESANSGPGQTLIVSDSAQLGEIAAISPYDRVFIHAVDGTDPVIKAATDFSLGYQMDVLHAADPAKILWYRKKTTTKKKKDVSDDLIRQIYYKKKPDMMDLNMEKGSKLLLEWIADNSVNAYLMRIYDLDKQDKSLVWNKKLSDLQLKHGSYPKRKELIVAGVLMSMPEKGINALLKCYGYKALSKHDYTEYVLILILNDMAKFFPSEFCFNEKYTANRADIDHGIQNIGARRQADRSDREGCLSLLRKWYPRWFYEYDQSISQTVVNERIYIDNQNWYTVEPQEYFDAWSVRKHVLWCLHAAGFPKNNWLVSGLANPMKEDEYPLG